MPPKAAQSQTPRRRKELRDAHTKNILNNALDSDSESEEVDEGPWIPVLEENKVVAFQRKTDGLECRVGDCVVLVGSDGNNWVGLLKRFVGKDDEGDECAEFVWFANEKEIRSQHKKRKDFLPNELYLTPGEDESPLLSIIDKATILSAQQYSDRPIQAAKRGRKPKGYVETTFVCRRACQLKNTTYTEQFDWGEIKPETEKEVSQLVDKINDEIESIRQQNRGQRKPGSGRPVGRPPKRKKEELEEDDEEDVDDYKDEGLEDIAEDEDDDDGNGSDGYGDIVKTPRKKKKFSKTVTPRKQRTPSKLLTPSHKRVMVKKPLEFTPLGTRMLDPESVQNSPFQTARSKLHVAAVPTSLPCREDEFASVYSHLEAAIFEGTGACIYISGTPGTGKTATVREVVAQLNASVMADEIDDFIFVEINGMKVTDPHQSYSLLWEALKGDRVSPSHALDLLEREFNHPSPRRVPCVVLMDELDQLVTKNQSVMYNFFNWPGLRHSKLIVLAVANTMDLPERTLSNKISSRLGLTRITFPGYNHDQLMKIIQSRLEGVPGNIVDPDAIQFASRKVAAVSGDARRALDICRRAVELAESDSQSAVPSTPSKSGKGEKISKNVGRVTIATVKRAINEATTSPLQQYLRGLPLSSKILLAALLAKTRRSGIAESILGDVLDEARRMAKMDTGGQTGKYLLTESNTMKSVAIWKPQPGKAPRVLAMGLAAVDLMEAGIIGLEARKADRTGKIRLSIGEEDLKLAFKDDPEIKNLGFSA
ncbi:hypothetical protein HYFRA_00003412 [Hymenoscyphus fraxineus]|uniref:Origin recognition complex subunit 1 n=1 Tax=Hymenoscyphus fraxineus TaxID=746836 RepID=A0A9N9PN90_9HELO|nr:hypothetical protein HYFRA_00003412 [Hymenoscyphus fraxineus]